MPCASSSRTQQFARGWESYTKGKRPADAADVPSGETAVEAGQDEVEASHDRGRRWYHLRPKPRNRADLMGFNRGGTSWSVADGMRATVGRCVRRALERDRIGGAQDRLMDAYNSYAMVRRLPNANLIISGDAGHAFLFQHAEAFGRQVLDFLSAP